MARKLQHIVWADQRDHAEERGEKVATLCGKRVYPMTKMSEEIPTCTPCSRETLAEFKKLRESTSWVKYSWTMPGGAA